MNSFNALETEEAVFETTIKIMKNNIKNVDNIFNKAIKCYSCINGGKKGGK